MKQKIVLSTLILFYLLSNCGSDKQTLNNFLPNATGTDSEMLIVMDSSKFKKKLGRSVINVFGENIYGLPQPEPYFDLKYIRPKNFNNILKFAKKQFCSLQGQGALVTGASAGIGSAIVERLAECGVNVCVVARRVEKLKELKNKLETMYPDVEIFPLRLDVGQLGDQMIFSIPF